jgi:hypothetical protein
LPGIGLEMMRARGSLVEMEMCTALLICVIPQMFIRRNETDVLCAVEHPWMLDSSRTEKPDYM